MAKPDHKHVLIGRVEKIRVAGEVVETVLHVMEPGDTAHLVEGAEYVTIGLTSGGYEVVLRGTE